MIEYKTGDMFTDDAEAIVNTVNCVGVMGRGIALQFKKRFLENFTIYEAACKRKEVMPGKMLVYETGSIMNPKYIINFPTKRHWRGASRMEDIETGLAALVEVIRERHITSIAIPPLGCGLGGLDWNLVRNKMETTLGTLSDIQINIYQPGNTPQAETMIRNQKVPAMTPGRAALVELIQSYLNGLLDPFITLLEVHKLMYFLQEGGENLRLHFVKAPFGPYAENLRHVLNVVEGHLIIGYADGGDDPKKQLQLVPGAEEDADKFLKQHQDTCNRIKRVENLVDGYETPFGLELLATIHWIAQHDSPKSLKDVINLTYAWSNHKKQFDSRQIELALSRLIKEGWISPLE